MLANEAAVGLFSVVLAPLPPPNPRGQVSAGDVDDGLGCPGAGADPKPRGHVAADSDCPCAAKGQLPMFMFPQHN